MAAGRNQKQKMLYLARIFMQETDDEHALNTQELIDRLETCGVNEDRKTLYKDVDELAQFGFDIIKEKSGRNMLYHLGARQFEIPELKLLVDSVQSARFITERKSRKLIRKLESLTSRNGAVHLHRQVIMSGRIKAENESIFYNVDRIHEAINTQQQITFQYFQWNEKKEKVLRHEGKRYQVSPWYLIWDDEYYYMVAYDAKEQLIKHYRVDKMLRITVVEKPREGETLFRDFDAAAYSNRLFGMFGGETTHVTLECRSDMAGVLIDRFGRDITFVPAGDGLFSATIPVCVSRQFLGWVFSLGDGVRITAPAALVSQMREEAERLLRTYGG